MLNKTVLRVAISIALLLSLCAGMLGGCGKNREQEDLHIVVGTKKSHEERFDELVAELFEDIITSDSITMNYFLAYPERLGIDVIEPTFGEVTSAETIARGRQENLDFIEELSGFVYDELRPDQQVIYDILRIDADLYSSMDENDDFPYYLGAIRPLNGLQVNLPIVLTEFHFYTEADIEIYLKLLEDINRYYDELIEFERERSRRGFFLSDGNVDKVLEHCESFLEDPENCFMILVFNERIDSREGLSAEQREQFKERNRSLVLNNVMPAYEAIMAAMQELRGVGANSGGLASLPDGPEFARYYLYDMTGSGRTPEQMDSLMAKTMDDLMSDIRAMLSDNPRLMDGYFNDTLGSIRDDTPENYLADLEIAITRDFPAILPTRYVVNDVHESMQDHVSPAFYLTAALDAYDDNVIYINPPSISDNISLFTTLAHEGYPGHMYQTVYYLQQHPAPLRTVLGDWGYTEGWATYVENQSYFYAGLDENEADFLQKMNLYDLMFITRIDLGVNCLGWGFNAVASFCREQGITDREVVGEVFDMVTGNPLLYLPYCMGYLEFVALRDEAESALGDSFDLREFHKFLLDFGPAPFTVIRPYMLEWIGWLQPSGYAAAA